MATDVVRCRRAMIVNVSYADVQLVGEPGDLRFMVTWWIWMDGSRKGRRLPTARRCLSIDYEAVVPRLEYHQDVETSRET